MTRAGAIALLIASSALATPSPVLAQYYPVDCSSPHDAEEAALCRNTAPRRSAPATAPVRPPTPAPTAAPKPAYKPNWQTIEADNGAAYKVDLNSIGRGDNGADIVVYIVEGGGYNPQNMTRFLFDCQGHHYMDERHFGSWAYAPPRSVAGRIEGIACAGAKVNATPNQPQGIPRTQNTDSSPVNKAFVSCLLAQGRDGPYATSSPAADGGKSVLMLLGQCEAQWDAWQKECIGMGFTDGGPGGCTTKAYLVAFAVLKSLGK